MLAKKRAMNVIHNANFLQYDISFKTAINNPAKICNSINGSTLVNTA